MVLTCLWDEEMCARSRVLRSETLVRLGSAKQIVRTHLDQVLENLSEDEREVAARLFHTWSRPAERRSLTRSRIWRFTQSCRSGKCSLCSRGSPHRKSVCCTSSLVQATNRGTLRFSTTCLRAEAERHAIERQQEVADQHVQDMQRILARCSSFSEAVQSMKREARPDARPFDIIVLGGGTFGAIVAQHLFDRDRKHSHRILVLEGGPFVLPDFVLPDYVQNLLMLGFKLPPPTSFKELKRIKHYGLGKSREGVWRLPWYSKVSCPGLAYCIGGRSLFWGGWAPRPLESEMPGWPSTVVAELKAISG
jgi:hypothetical protein